MIFSVSSYIDKMNATPNHRFRSWEHCYAAFSKKNTDINTLSLHLAFYLASWGMMRGSCGLLQKDYFVHEGAVKILMQPKYYDLKKTHLMKEHISTLLELSDRLSEYYESVTYAASNGEEDNITATPTLISKVMLGVLGCIPAFDRYFTLGAELHNLNIKKIDKPSLERLFKFIDENDLQNIQKKLNEKYGINYPVMKIVDMYFWEKGFQKN